MVMHGAARPGKGQLRCDSRLLITGLNADSSHSNTELRANVRVLNLSVVDVGQVSM